LALVFFVPQGFLAGAEAGATAFGALPLPVSWVHVHDYLSVWECQSCIIL
jgi:hypothetical protein